MLIISEKPQSNFLNQIITLINQRVSKRTHMLVLFNNYYTTDTSSSNIQCQPISSEQSNSDIDINTLDRIHIASVTTWRISITLVYVFVEHPMQTSTLISILPKHVKSPLAPCLTHACQTGGLLLLTTFIIDCNSNLKQYMTCTCYNLAS